jgi:putative Mn2+ efflux pump MntP
MSPVPVEAAKNSKTVTEPDMSLFWAFLLALGLSFDTFAVSVSGGIVCKRMIFRQACIFSLVMAVFQGMMPVVGWLAGVGIHSVIEAFDHWVASGILFIVAFRMIYASFSGKSETVMNPLRYKTMFALAMATSIDALAVGFSLAFIPVSLPLLVVIIGLITFLSAMTGLFIGKKTGEKTGKHLEFAGAIILIAIGIKILISHLA